MDIGGYRFPDELYYDKNHGWAAAEGNTVTQGVTAFAQKISKEIVYVEVPRSGRKVEQGQTFMSMESGKWVGRIAAMVSGTLSEANEELEWDVAPINEDPFGEGWLAKIEASDLGELDNLLKASDDEFKAFIESEIAKFKDILA
ncbi:MAG: glycine cleavage system protein GcvH [Anaerolineae bacterium]|nr:glycine cleavage system protein GcvH [Anaerolineae bacterium]